MKKTALFSALVMCFAIPAVGGCGGGGEDTVIAAPTGADEAPDAMEGMTDEEYNAAMQADMAGSGQ